MLIKKSIFCLDWEQDNVDLIEAKFEVALSKNRNKNIYNDNKYHTKRVYTGLYFFRFNAYQMSQKFIRSEQNYCCNYCDNKICRKS